MLLTWTGALGDKDDKDEKKSESAEEEDPEIAEARREAEERRNEKYRKMEEEREIMRQGIREKVSDTFVTVFRAVFSICCTTTIVSSLSCFRLK